MPRHVLGNPSGGVRVIDKPIVDNKPLPASLPGVRYRKPAPITAAVAGESRASLSSSSSSSLSGESSTKTSGKTSKKTPPARRESSVSSLSASASSSSSAPLRPASRGGGSSHKNEPVKIDETLWKLVNKRKVLAKKKPEGGNDDELSSADSSGRHARRKSVGDAFRSKSISQPRPVVARLPPPPSIRRRNAPQRPPPSAPRRQAMPAVMSSSSGSDDEQDDDDDSSSDDEEDSSSDDDVAPHLGARVLDPLEEETLKAVRKAKLLARLEQMEAKGIKRSKVFNYRSNEEELMVEVARMEVLAERATRIEQGRSALMTLVKTVERGACFVDRRKYLPVKANLGGFSGSMIKDIDRYDDCLERGVAETLGPSSSRVWWVEMLYILIPSMVWYSMTNRMTEDPKYASEVIRQNPEFQRVLAKEVAREMSHTENVERARLEAELQQARQELERQTVANTSGASSLFTSPSVGGNASQAHSQQQPTRTTAASKNNNSRPPSSGNALPTTNPLGDYPVDETETRKMQAFLKRQQDQTKNHQRLPPPPSQRKPSSANASSGAFLDLGDSDEE